MESSPINAVGIWFYSVSTSRYLYLLRNDPKHPGAWGLPGGKVEGKESLLDAMKRECEEELGSFPDTIKIVPIEQFTSADNHFIYHTFFAVVGEEFTPTLNNEHLGYAWVNTDTIPKPLHPGLWSTINIEEVKSKVKIVEESVS
jgi:8-oxo-dGTP pyrophosphatase MutT (NUDIX family)